MIEEVLPNLFRVELPLPGIPLGAVNAYVVRSARRSLIVDPGMDREECWRAMLKALEEVRVDVRGVDFFITHLHLDHLGLVARLKTDSSKVFFGASDAKQVGSPTEWDETIQFGLTHGFPERELRKVLKDHPGYQFKQSPSKGLTDFTLVAEGQGITVGAYAFKVIETPGHSPGHLCLYEHRQKVLISGDHLLNEITPTIQAWSEDKDPLREYLSSLGKIEALDIERVLPGHGAIFGGCKERIEELRDHHRERAEEVIRLLQHRSLNAYQLASQMRWDVDYGSWDLFPALHKWFAVGETLAHLKYLEGEGRMRREMHDQRVKFLLM